MTNNPKFLIVEDEPDGQDVIQRLLGYFNYETDAVYTAEEALQLLNHNAYDAVIIDLGLPGMDGVELVKMIRTAKATENLPCIAVTAYHTSAVKHSALDAGCDAYFAKPIDDTAFVRELDRIVSNT